VRAAVDGTDLDGAAEELNGLVSDEETSNYGPVYDLAERLAVPKRSLRVVKWLGQVPAVGVCTFCDRLFTVPVTALKRVSDAQESLRVQSRLACKVLSNALCLSSPLLMPYPSPPPLKPKMSCRMRIAYGNGNSNRLQSLLYSTCRLLLIFSLPTQGQAEALLDNQTAFVFVLVAILAFLFSLRDTPKLRH
jgi:hypothetical protein